MATQCFCFLHNSKRSIVLNGATWVLVYWDVWKVKRKWGLTAWDDRHEHVPDSSPRVMSWPECERVNHSMASLRPNSSRPHGLSMINVVGHPLEGQRSFTSIIREQRDLEKDISSLLVDGGLPLPTLLIKRCLPAYYLHRIDRLRDMYWAPHLLSSPDIRSRLSPHEVDYLRQYNSSVIMEFRSEFSHDLDNKHHEAAEGSYGHHAMLVGHVGPVQAVLPCRALHVSHNAVITIVPHYRRRISDLGNALLTQPRIQMTLHHLLKFLTTNGKSGQVWLATTIRIGDHVRTKSIL